MITLANRGPLRHNHAYYERSMVMIKAIVKNGVVVPRVPLPSDWRDGTEVDVEKSSDQPSDADAIQTADAWMDEVERCAAQQDPADDDRLQQAIDEERRLAKDLARQGKM
jgi:hypothetical protein